VRSSTRASTGSSASRPSTTTSGAGWISGTTLTYRFKWDTGTRKPGVLVRWVSPGDWLAVQINSSDQRARLMRRKDDDSVSTLKTSGTALSLSAATWYTGKVVVDDDPNNAALQRLRFWVDTDDDGDFGDETVLLTSTQVDDDWSGGYVGLFRGNQDTNTHQFDDFKVGYDNNADGDFDDGGDVIAIDDDFGDSVTNGAISLSYDANGNLTDDGVFAFVYDAWNRLRKAKLVVGANETTIGDYDYYGEQQRSRMLVTNHGTSRTLHVDGNGDLRFYYARRGGLSEVRNGSNQTAQQLFRGAGGLVFYDTNGDTTESNDTNPDVQTSEAIPDERFFVHAGGIRTPSLLTGYDPAGIGHGNVTEQYVSTATRYVLGVRTTSQTTLQSRLGFIDAPRSLPGPGFRDEAPPSPDPRDPTMDDCAVWGQTHPLASNSPGACNYSMGRLPSILGLSRFPMCAARATSRISLAYSLHTRTVTWFSNGASTACASTCLMTHSILLRP